MVKILSIRILPVLFFGFCTVFVSKAQGSVHFNESNEIEMLLNNFVRENRENPQVKGWRIQLVSTPDRRTMDGVRAKFSSRYPGIPSSWEHVAPNYQVRIGAYYTKPELMSLLIRLRQDFPMATPVTDMIDKIDLIPY